MTGLSKKNVLSGTTRVFRKGNGIQTGVGGGSSGGGGVAPSSASPVTIRSEYTVSVTFPLGQSPAGTPIRFFQSLVFDYNYGVPSLNNPVLVGWNCFCVVQGGLRPFWAQINRQGTNKMPPTAEWTEAHGSYTFKGKILLEVPVSWVTVPQQIGEWAYVGGSGATYSTGVQSDNSQDLTSLGYNLAHLGDPAYTQWHVVVTQGSSPFTFSAVNSYDNAVFFRRNANASDTTWLALGITW